MKLGRKLKNLKIVARNKKVELWNKNTVKNYFKGG